MFYRIEFLFLFPWHISKLTSKVQNIFSQVKYSIKLRSVAWPEGFSKAVSLPVTGHFQTSRAENWTAMTLAIGRQSNTILCNSVQLLLPRPHSITITLAAVAGCTQPLSYLYESINSADGIDTTMLLLYLIYQPQITPVTILPPWQ